MSQFALRNLLLSLHLLGVFLLLIGIAIEIVTLVLIRKAKSVEGLRQSLIMGPVVEKIMPVASMLIVLGGIWLAFLGGHEYSWHSAWIITSFLVAIAFSLNGSLYIGKKVEHLAHEAFRAKDGPLPPDLAELCHEQQLHDRAWIGVGVVFSFIVLMTDKPNWIGSIAATIVGALIGLFIARRSRSLAPVKTGRKVQHLTKLKHLHHKHYS